MRTQVRNRGLLASCDRFSLRLEFDTQIHPLPTFKSDIAVKFLVFYRKHCNSCRRCGETLWYGVKEEPAGWKVFYECHNYEDCGRERYVGRIPREHTEHLDDVFAQAQQMAPKI